MELLVLILSVENGGKEERKRKKVRMGVSDGENEKEEVRKLLVGRRGGHGARSQI